MAAVIGADLLAAADEMTRTLMPHRERDWSVPAGTLTWSCWTTAAHVAHDLLAYAGQVTGRPDDSYLPYDLRVSPAASPAQTLAVVRACAGLLAVAVDAAGPDVRAWHYGPCDPAGFAAMGVAETLLHTHDITLGLDVPWQPPQRLSALVLRRLFPDAPAGAAPEVLLWMTGRGELPGRARRTSWTWRAAVD
ncbi:MULTISPECIES: maleylpyruvate isomerase N-terminal domain-containing protein [unclassified Micromonospora]|uniref:maleylpyruvate isomerase N-terminal domain-containing protein n=1 Tax=unclassified Micromonospora TaxID=2617518 RepID=UPI001CED39E6|nr:MULTISPECIES: maleylpyruvate isomerase N-terminal domain-containing protein [unclassified Micromonospora]MDG4758046.1 maleylpyruvate isomerase N-terminal domain-containing protein [Micromonospora sp. WMMD710]